MALPSGFWESRAPVLSSTLTALGFSSGTDEDTRCTMPAICARSRVRPPRSVSMTEALGFCCSRKKPFCCGMARWTRASATSAMAVMVRVSSPSSARWKFSRSLKAVWPMDCLSISSKPTTPPLGRPADASFMRRS